MGEDKIKMNGVCFQRSTVLSHSRESFIEWASERSLNGYEQSYKDKFLGEMYDIVSAEARPKKGNRMPKATETTEETTTEP